MAISFIVDVVLFRCLTEAVDLWNSVQSPRYLPGSKTRTKEAGEVVHSNNPAAVRVRQRVGIGINRTIEIRDVNRTEGDKARVIKDRTKDMDKTRVIKGKVRDIKVKIRSPTKDRIVGEAVVASIITAGVTEVEEGAGVGTGGVIIKVEFTKQCRIFASESGLFHL